MKSDEQKHPIDEALCARVLEVLRKSGRPLTVAEIHPEANVAQKEYVPAGRVEGTLRVLLDRGLAERHGETWAPVAPGTLAMRRGSLLDELARSALRGEAAGRHGDKLTAEQRCDADALVRAGLLREQEGELTCLVDTAQQLVGRGAVLAVSSSIPECRAPAGGTPLVLAPEAAQQEVAKEAAARASAEQRLQQADAEAEGLAARVAEAQRTLEALTNENTALRSWFRDANLPCPVGDATKAQQDAPLAEFYFPIKVDWTVRGRMSVLRSSLKQKLADIDAELRVAKSGHKTKRELAEKKIESLDAQLFAAHYDARAYRHVDLAKGVVEIRCVDDPSWLLAVQPLRPEAPQAVSSPEPAQVPLAAGERPPIQPDAAPVEPPAPEEPEKPSPPPLSIESVQAALVRFCEEAPESLSLERAHEKLALLWPTEATNAPSRRRGGTAGPFGKLVKAAAEQAADKGLIRLRVVDGVTWIGAAIAGEPGPEIPEPEEKPVKPERQSRAKSGPRNAGVMAAPSARAREALAGAPEGLSKAELMEKARLAEEEIKELIETGVILRNGKRGFAARFLKG